MAHALLCMSHSPLLHHAEPPQEIRSAVDSAFSEARRFVHDFDPDLIINFGPDHYNGFFYELMPPFCIGLTATGVGDYDSFAGDLDVPLDLAEDLASFVMEQEIDLAVSMRMMIDHGAVQPMEIVFDGNVTARPVIPVFINSVAGPFVRTTRIRRLGEAIGTFFHNSDKRVLFLGSGGLSHDPPIPQITTANQQQREMLISGRNPSPETRAARQAHVIATARSFAEGTADIMDLNPDWDREFLAVCRSGDVARFDGYTASDMTDAAGHSSHEVRTWIAAYSALRACGEYDIRYEFYKPIKEYIAGFAVTIATLR